MERVLPQQGIPSLPLRIGKGVNGVLIEQRAVKWVTGSMDHFLGNFKR
jgi:hypothetical protein